jgi:hypothetical protein
MRKLQLLSAGALAAILLAACSGSGDSATPTSPSSSALVVSNAAVYVGTQDVSGTTMPVGHDMDGTTRFEAHLAMPMLAGDPTRMWLHYDRPGSMGMMGQSGTVRMYDDGTHGDRTPGDGLYCLADDETGTQEIGCHGAGAPMGTYHYDFYATAASRESNHVRVTVSVVGG